MPFSVVAVDDGVNFLIVKQLYALTDSHAA